MSNGRDTNVSIWYMFRGGRLLALLRLLLNCVPAIIMLVVEDIQLYESFLSLLGMSGIISGLAVLKKEKDIKTNEMSLYFHLQNAGIFLIHKAI